MILTRSRIAPRPSIRFPRLFGLVSLFVGTAMAATTGWAQPTMPDGQKVVFRYRCFTGDRPTWVSPLTTAGGIVHTSGSGHILTINRGTGFSNYIATLFDGSSQFIQGADALSTTDTASNDSFTVEVKFRLDSAPGARTLFSNATDERGFSLQVVEGRLQGLTRFLDGAVVRSEVLAMDAGVPDVETGKWHHAVYRVSRNAGAGVYEMHLFLNGAEVARRNTPSLWNGVGQSPEKPLLGAEPVGGTGGADFFAGAIYTVEVSNWALPIDDYIVNTVIRDGSRHFGIPSYHDYLDGKAGIPYLLHSTISSYPQFNAQVSRRLLLPYANDDYVVQGISYDNENDLFYMSFYHITTAGTTGTHPSIVTEVTRDGRLRRTFQLLLADGGDMTGHVGGIAYHNNSFYVPYGSAIYRYDLDDLPEPEYLFDPETFANPRGDQNAIRRAASYQPNRDPNTSFSNMEIHQDYNGDYILWTSQHSTSVYTKVLGYLVDSAGAIALTPTYSFTLPVLKVQGVACYQATPTHFHFYLSTSYGDNPSVMYSCRYPRSGGAAQELTTVFTGPAGMEDVTFNARGELWTSSESGGKYYQKRSSNPWQTFYPFAFAVETWSSVGDWPLH